MSFGMVERGGNIITRVVPNAIVKALFPHISGKIEPGSTISTDEWPLTNDCGSIPTNIWW